MASTKAHHNTGVAAGVIAAVVVAKAGAGGPYEFWSVIAFLLACVGGTAPDWLEVAWWSRKHKLWITHRTWTHWGVAWVAALVYAYYALGQQFWAPALFGFTVGGIMHLLADWPNPMGVPWVYGRHSLKLWKSGKCDSVVVSLAWLGALLIADHVCFKNVHTKWLITTGKDLLSNLLS